MAPEVSDLAGPGSLVVGLSAGAYAIYKFWQQIKSDNKGDVVDARISQFTSTLQNQLDKAIARQDILQVSYNSLAIECATAKARAEALGKENSDLREQLSKSYLKNGSKATVTG